MNIRFCEQCGLPLIKTPSGYSSCPEMHGKLQTRLEKERSVWIERLVRSKVDVRELKKVEVTELVGKRGGKKKQLTLDGKVVKRDLYGEAGPPAGSLFARIGDTIGLFRFAT